MSEGELRLIVNRNMPDFKFSWGPRNLDTHGVFVGGIVTKKPVGSSTSYWGGNFRIDEKATPEDVKRWCIDQMKEFKKTVIKEEIS